MKIAKGGTGARKAECPCRELVTRAPSRLLKTTQLLPQTWMVMSIQKGCPGEEGSVRAEVGLGAQEKCFWNPGKVAQEAEAQNGSSMPWSADQSHSGKFTGQWP